MRGGGERYYILENCGHSPGERGKMGRGRGRNWFGMGQNRSEAELLAFIVVTAYQ